VQDATAGEVAAALAPREGATVLDLCAAPGGKTFALAEIVGPAGRVVAVDLPGPRATLLAEEGQRRGAANVGVVPLDATDAAALPAGARGAAPGFDAVLVDAPCSNTGVLAKRVEARRRLADGASLASLVALQTKLADAAATRVRPGGRLAWSTCSLDDDENGARVRAFLAAHAEFVLVEERLTLPVPGRRDGGYVAVMERRAAVTRPGGGGGEGPAP
jgi:16S rRNA (cytosine967-C5)-methyltransferase